MDAKDQILSWRNWSNLILCFAVTSIAWGTHASYGLFMKPMANDLLWNRATISANFSITLVVYGIFSIVMGRLADKYDIRKIVLVSAIALGAGFFLSSTVRSKWEFFTYYGLVIGMGLGATYVPLVAFLARDFPKRKGLAMGIVASGGGFGTLVMPQFIGNYLLGLGWRTSFTILALVNFTIVMTASILLRIQPQQSHRRVLESRELKEHCGDGMRDFNIRDSMMTMVFWNLFLCFLFWFLTLFLVQVHLVPYITQICASQLKRQQMY